MSPVVTLLVGADNVVFHASEATLCRVPFFRAALQGQSEHAAEKRIWLPEDVPPILSALLEHLYTGTYTYNRTIFDGTLTHDLPEGRFHVSVYAVATKYRWQPLVKAAVRNFLVVLPVLSGIDIVRLWKAAYEAGLTMSVCDSDGRLADFQMLLPKLLQGLYVTDTAEMESTIADLPSLANDIIQLLVAASGN
ncbi:hypothetical protein Q9L58_006231 [Maublancomyces gigas]|uniref:BTB domain-containing protein n=1 Tax=Discina gigas TaxID=1032678 RepID=A0ABR3GFR8_9PEZI